MEWGYGSPSSVSPGVTGQVVYDWGYGSPTPVGYLGGKIDTGWGSPSDKFTGLVLFPANGLLPDEGGWVCEAVCVNGFPDSVFRARFKNSATNNLYPDADFLYSAEPGSKTSLIPYGPVGAEDTIKFASPSCPPGVYHLILEYGPGFGQEITVPNAYTVVNRNRCRPALRGRLRMPPYYKTGAVLLHMLIVPSAPEELNPLECLTLAMGQSVQKVIGNPVTRITSDVPAGSGSLPVETTIGFTDSGSIFVGSLRFDYSGKTSTSFTGLTLSPSDQVWKFTIGDPEEVVYDASSYKPVD